MAFFTDDMREIETTPVAKRLFLLAELADGGDAAAYNDFFVTLLELSSTQLGVVLGAWYEAGIEDSHLDRYYKAVIWALFQATYVTYGMTDEDLVEYHRVQRRHIANAGDQRANDLNKPPE